MQLRGISNLNFGVQIMFICEPENFKTSSFLPLLENGTLLQVLIHNFAIWDSLVFGSIYFILCVKGWHEATDSKYVRKKRLENSVFCLQTWNQCSQPLKIFCQLSHQCGPPCVQFSSNYLCKFESYVRESLSQVILLLSFNIIDCSAKQFFVSPEKWAEMR